MAAVTCQECGAAEVRCTGLCPRCYAAARRASRRPAVMDGQALALERAWDAGQLVAALVAELPEPGRHQGASWVTRAACRVHPALPWDGVAVTEAIRAVCCACPVRDACLAEALADPGVAGVWAATTPADRRGLRLAHAP